MKEEEETEMNEEEEKKEEGQVTRYSLGRVTAPVCTTNAVPRPGQRLISRPVLSLVSLPPSTYGASTTEDGRGREREREDWRRGRRKVGKEEKGVREERKEEEQEMRGCFKALTKLLL